MQIAAGDGQLGYYRRFADSAGNVVSTASSTPHENDVLPQTTAWEMACNCLYFEYPNGDTRYIHSSRNIVVRFP